MPASTAVLDRLRSDRDEARNAAIALAEADDFDPTADAYTALEERATNLDGQIERLVNLMGQREAADALDGRLSRTAQRQDRDRQITETWGETFIRSDVFTTYPGRGTSSRLEIQTRALPTGIADLISAGMVPARTSVDATAPAPATPLLNAMSTVEVSGNSVEVVAWTKKAGGAAKVAEKGPKPSAEYGPVVTPTNLDTIAVYTQLTRQLIEDFAAVRSIIDNELRNEVARAEEAEAAAALVAATLPTASGADLLSAIRVGAGTVQAAGYNPTAVVLNPADWAELDVAVMGGTLNGPARGQSFWGLVPIAANSQPAGTATVGDFSAGVSHFIRSAIGLYITDSHADTFLSNVFTLLAERRSKTVVTRPAALCECTGA